MVVSKSYNSFLWGTMSQEITEELLEMYYCQPLAELLATHYGQGVMRIWKPSRIREAFLSFDHAWVLSSGNNRTLDQQLDIEIGQASTRGPQCLYIGYFLQFKVVVRMTRTDSRTQGAKSSISGAHYRCTLKTEPSNLTWSSENGHFFKRPFL